MNRRASTLLALALLFGAGLSIFGAQSALAAVPGPGSIVVIAYDGTVSAINPLTGAVQQVAAAGGLTDGGYGIARESDGNFVVASRSQDSQGNPIGRLTRVSTTGTKTNIAAGPLGDAVLAVGASPTTGALVASDEVAPGYCPGSEAVGIATGVMWIYNHDGSGAQCVDNATSQSLGGLTENNGTMGIVFDSSGQMFVSTAYGGGEGTGSILQVDPATGKQLKVVSSNSISATAQGAQLFQDLRGLALASDGTFYAVDDLNINGNPSCNPNCAAAAKIVGVDPTTGRQWLVSDNAKSVANGGQALFDTPYGVAVTSSGALAVTDLNGNLTMVDPETGKQTLLASGLGTLQGAVMVPGTPVAPATVPGAPTGVSALAGHGSATVSWSAPGSDGGSPVTGYSVTASPGGASVTVGGSARSATVSGLVNGTVYSFKVRASNAVGSGASSAASNSVTPVAPVVVKPPSKVTGVQAVLLRPSTGRRDMRISWNKGTSVGAPITRYEVRVIRPGKPALVISVKASSLSWTWVKAPAGRYSVTVRAFNSVGAGTASSAVSFTVPTR